MIGYWLRNVSIALFLTALSMAAPLQAADEEQKEQGLGSKENPIIITLLPERETGTSDLELPDFLRISPYQPLHFKLMVSESYIETVEDFCSGIAHLAALSMVTYSEMQNTCDTGELLAVEINGGASVYYSGIFTHRKNFQRNSREISFHMLETKSIAFGSPHSTTSFHYPLKMLLDFGLSIPEELDKVHMAGSHSAAIEMLAEGDVELAASSFQSWKAAIDEGTIDPILYMPLIKSSAIPLPPLVMNSTLPDKTKLLIRRVFKDAHTRDEADYFKGVRGRRINRYDLERVKEEGYLASLKNFEAVDIELIESVGGQTNDSGFD